MAKSSRRAGDYAARLRTPRYRSSARVARSERARGSPSIFISNSKRRASARRRRAIGREVANCPVYLDELPPKRELALHRGFLLFGFRVTPLILSAFKMIDGPRLGSSS